MSFFCIEKKSAKRYQKTGNVSMRGKLVMRVWVRVRVRVEVEVEVFMVRVRVRVGVWVVNA